MGTLLLNDGTVIKGESFGATAECMGELVFNTSMAGYQEILTDPSYAGQIVVMTYPEIGNYGINNTDFESDKSSVAGFIVKEHCKTESHYKSYKSLVEYLKGEDITALDNIDTRSLVKKIRLKGTINALISSANLGEATIKAKLKELQTFKIKENIIEDVTCKSKYLLNTKGSIKIGFVDYGVKKGILDSLVQRGCRVTVYPCSVNANEILEDGHDAVFLSNGPGDPADCNYQILQIKQLMGRVPLFGICLGYQMLAIASGAKTYKLKFGHRGANHPVMNLKTNKVIITSQNHGYAVDDVTLTKSMIPTYKNLNDDTLEGFEIPELNVYAVQFHPEANPGPRDAETIFDEWITKITNLKELTR